MAWTYAIVIVSGRNNAHGKAKMIIKTVNGLRHDGTVTRFEYYTDGRFTVTEIAADGTRTDRTPNATHTN
jgi:hypothetical protein